jgi:hypothetical protein
MRAYVSVTPQQIEQFYLAGTLRFPFAFALTPLYSKSNLGADDEEMEFELSYMAAAAARSNQDSVDGYGFVLAVDLGESQKGQELAETVELIADLSWSQVESVLVAESEEPELTWFAAQEVATQLPDWLSKQRLNK